MDKTRSNISGIEVQRASCVHFSKPFPTDFLCRPFEFTHHICIDGFPRTPVSRSSLRLQDVTPLNLAHVTLGAIDAGVGLWGFLDSL